MDKTQHNKTNLIGIALPGKTTNENGRSAIDCGSLWQQFEAGKYVNNIPGKLSDNVYAVYHSYEGDFTKPFSYFIGCEVADGTEVPEGMYHLTLAPGEYQVFIAKGKMPDCVGNAWREIWQSGIERAYNTDFEIYTEKSQNWNDAEVEIFIGLK